MVPPGAHKFADDGHFLRAVNGVFLGKLVPFHIQPGGLQLADLPLRFRKRQQRIVMAVGDEQPLRPGDRRQVAERFSISNTQPLMPTMPASRCG